MAHSQNKRHPLGDRHFRQIVCRPQNLRKRMYPVWAMTWRPGGNNSSFLGKLFRPIGSPLMMSQISYPAGDREGIALFGVAAQINPQTAVVAYEDVRLRHHFHFVPYPGAGGAVLDPREDKVGGRGNASWVQLGLEVDRVRQRAAERNFQLPAVPCLPDIYFGYGDQAGAKFEITPELIQRAAHDMEINWGGTDVSDLRNLRAEQTTAKQQAFAALSAEEQAVRLQAAWAAAFIKPNDDGNDTGLWLLPHSLSTNVYAATRVFEYFGGLVGAHVFNPARQLTGTQVPNVAIDVAKEAGIDLAADLASIAELGDNDPVYLEVEAKLLALLPAYRAKLGASEAIADADLLGALCTYADPVTIAPAVQDVPEAEQVRLMRATIKPHFSDCCTDADLLQAVQAPNSALFASGLCAVQCLYRNVRVPLDAALRFGPQELGRERVQATMWYDLPQGRSQPRVKSEELVEDAAAA